MKPLAAAIALLALAAPGTASAAWTPLGELSAAPASDGERFVVLPQVDGSLLVLDDRDVASPRRFAVPDGCRFNGVVGSGRAVLDCAIPGLASRPAVADLTTGARSSPIDLPEFRLGALGAFVTGVGRRWLEVTLSGNHWQLRRYVRISDGAVRRVDSTAHAPDLDATNVRRPLCAPVRRPPDPDRDLTENRPSQGEVVRAGREVVFVRGTHPDGERFDGRELVAWRCGSRKPRVISRCRPGCHPVPDGGRWGLLLRPGAVVALGLADGSRTWISTGGIGGEPAALVRTRTLLVGSRPSMPGRQVAFLHVLPNAP